MNTPPRPTTWLEMLRAMVADIEKGLPERREWLGLMRRNEAPLDDVSTATIERFATNLKCDEESLVDMRATIARLEAEAR